MKPYSDIPGFRETLLHGGSSLRRWFIRSCQPELVCSCCGLSEWLGQPMRLQLDHIDGVRENNTRANLRLLCPNCHSLTPTFSRGSRRRSYGTPLTPENIQAAYNKVESRGAVPSIAAILRELDRGPQIRTSHIRNLIREGLRTDQPLATYTRVKEHSRNKIQWMSDEELIKAMSNTSVLQLSKLLGVSDVAIRKRCRARGIPVPDGRKRRNVAQSG